VRVYCGVIQEIIATLAAGIFAGAAVYINLVEHPARLSCGVAAAVMEWRSSYKRGALMQAPLAFVGSLAAFVSWWLHRDWAWMAGGLFLLLVIPFTFVVILPTNKRLENPALDVHSEDARRLLQRWNRLHAVRSILSAAAFLIFLLQLALPR
jgi:Domain of unknown function (DUF1772)